MKMRLIDAEIEKIKFEIVKAGGLNE